MGGKFFDWYSGCVAYFVSLGSFIAFYSLGCATWGLGNLNVVWGGCFCFDIVGGLLCILSILLGLSLICLVGGIKLKTVFMVLVSVVASILCFLSCNSLVFWLFYEISILSLLFLLISESPYSERYVAAWYLIGYIVLTSLPMLLSILYLCVLNGSLNMFEWVISDSGTSCILFLLGVLFVTKVPVPPFHVWLPIVHAEAESVVSVCLSGYIMKLGLLGVCRFCVSVLPGNLFNCGYVGFAFCMSLLFFLCACRELDGKRWLAFLSLSHILIVVVYFSCVSWSLSSLSILYSLGHGLSAGLIFIMLWWCYEVCGSRNWLVLKSVFGGHLFNRGLLCLCLCTAASLPPTVQFFCEVYILGELCFYNKFLFLIFILYLFMSSLVPLFLFGSLITRHYDVLNFTGNSFFSFVCSMLLLGFISFFIFVLF